MVEPGHEPGLRGPEPTLHATPLPQWAVPHACVTLLTASHGFHVWDLKVKSYTAL